MSNDLMLIFLIAISLFVMQAVGGVFQIKNYKAAIRRVHKKGNVGIGQKKGRFFNGWQNLSGKVSPGEYLAWKNNQRGINR